jgi:hypothetical protein
MPMRPRRFAWSLAKTEDFEGFFGTMPGNGAFARGCSRSYSSAPIW